MVQLSYPYMTTAETIALTTQTFVGKVMPLLFNVLSRLVIAFLLRSKGLLILRVNRRKKKSSKEKVFARVIQNCFHCIMSIG